MTVIEYAEKRMNECVKNHEDHYTRYFAAYLDGSRAQLKECKNKINEYKKVFYQRDYDINKAIDYIIENL